MEVDQWDVSGKRGALKSFMMLLFCVEFLITNVFIFVTFCGTYWYNWLQLKKKISGNNSFVSRKTFSGRFDTPA